MNATEAKRRVLAVHPDMLAWEPEPEEGYSWWTIGLGLSILATADTEDEAWIAAAAGLEERNEQPR